MRGEGGGRWRNRGWTEVSGVGFGGGMRWRAEAGVWRVGLVKGGGAGGEKKEGM